MAILGRIRERGILLVVVVGIAMLAFIIGDFLNSGATFFSAMNSNVAKVNGEKVDAMKYQDAIEQLTDVYKIEYGRSDINEDMMAQIRAQVWESTINEILLNDEAEKLGLTVTADELSNHIIGNKIHPVIMQRRAFADQSGQFSRQTLVNFLANIEQADESNSQAAQAKSYYMFWENMVRNDLLQNKYLALVSKAVTANSLDAKMAYDARLASNDVAYVVYPYVQLADSTFSASDAEVKARYKKQLKTYRQEPYRSVVYVRYEKQPSEADYQETEKFINDLKAEFDTTENVAELVTYNSDIPYQGINYSETTIPEDLHAFAFSGKVGDVTPVALVGDVYRTARIMETGILTPDSVKLAHIYLAEPDSVRADSIMKAVQKGADWGEMVKRYSADTQSAANQGELGWFEENTLDGEIADKAFTLPAKQTFLFNNGQGLQIIRIQERTPLRKKVKVAILERQVTPSSRTIADTYNEAKQLAAASKTVEQLTEETQKIGKTVMPAVNIQQGSERVGNLRQSRPVVRWAYQAKEGAVSDVFECDDVIVVAGLTKIADDQYRSLNDAADEIRTEVIRDKKADKMAEELNALLASNKSLQAIADNVHAEIDTVENVSAATNYFGGAGMEPAVIGKASALKDGEISAPVKGLRGVYVLQSIGAKQNEAAPFDAALEANQLNMRQMYALPQQAMEALRLKADIEDKRLKLY